MQSARLRKCYCCCKKGVKARYNLTQPKPSIIEIYFRTIRANLLGDCEAKSELVNNLYADAVKLQCKRVDKTVCMIVSRKLVNKALQQCQKSAGVLLASIRSVKSITLRLWR